MKIYDFWCFWYLLFYVLDLVHKFFTIGIKYQKSKAFVVQGSNYYDPLILSGVDHNT